MSTQEWPRRKFIRSAAGTAIALTVGPFLSSASHPEDKSFGSGNRTFSIDSHNHVDVPLNKAEWPVPQVDLAGEMKRSGLSAICMTFAVDYQQLTREGEAYERFSNGLDAMDEVLKRNKMGRALNLNDLQSISKRQEPIVIQSVEGGHFLEGRIERLEIAYKRGLRHLGLLHDNDASVPLGDVYTNPPRWNGLSPFGIEVIKECNRLGILIDLTHCSNDAINAALKITRSPVVISHTGLDTQLGQNADMARMMKPRLISAKQAKIVADAGGVIGVWTHLSDSALEYAQNIRAMVDVVGVDHVCIGTDTKMTPSYRPGMDPTKSQARIGERTNGAWKDQVKGFYVAVTEALLKAGFTEMEIGKIGGGNYIRVFDAATAAPANKM
jgi:membrane dipeptidase